MSDQLRKPAVPLSARPFRAIIFLLLLLPAFAAPARAQQVDLEQLEAYIAAARTEWQVPGLAVAIVKDGGRKIVSHGGGYDGMYSRVVMVPEENLAAVILSNSMTGIATALSNRILDEYLGAPERDWSSELLKLDQEGRQRFYDRIEEAVKPKASGTTPSLPLERYAGTYGGPFYGDATVTMEEGALVLRLLPAAELVADLTHLHHDTFRLDWRQEFAWFGPGTAHFVLNAEGQPAELKLDVPNEDLWFHEIELRRK